MKRLFILIIATIFGTISLLSKSIEIVSADYLVSVSPNSDEAKAHCVFKNISDKTIDVKLYINLLEASEGLDVSFCWGPICYPPLSVNSPRQPNDVVTLQPGQVSGDNEFYLTFSPNGYEGEAIVEAVLFVATDPEDSLHITFRLSSLLGIVDVAFINPLNFIAIHNSLDLEVLGFSEGLLELYSIDGSLLQSFDFVPKKDISTLPKGIYLIVQQKKKRKVLINKL